MGQLGLTIPTEIELSQLSFDGGIARIVRQRLFHPAHRLCEARRFARAQRLDLPRHFAKILLSGAIIPDRKLALEIGNFFLQTTQHCLYVPQLACRQLGAMRSRGSGAGPHLALQAPVEVGRELSHQRVGVGETIFAVGGEGLHAKGVERGGGHPRVND